MTTFPKDQKNESSFLIPILIVIFNRPDAVVIIIEKLRAVRPASIFIAADGPRFPIKDEVSLCEQARAIALQIDWPCQVKILFSDKNLGCGMGVSTAITWFFEHVEEGLIIEDDCVPYEGFFDFCAVMLKKYRYDDHVMMISGANMLGGRYADQEGHFLSKYYAIWGWATWRRAWQKFDLSLENWRANLSQKQIEAFFKNKLIAKKWASHFDLIAEKKLDSWGMPWAYACIKNKAFCVTPLQNLISNIGIVGAHANGVKSHFHELPTQKINVTESYRTIIPAARSRFFDIEMYKATGYLYYDPYWRKCGRAVKRFFRKAWQAVQWSKV